MTEKQEVKGHKAEGTLASFPINIVNNNPHRPNEVFKWNEEKLKGLIESFYGSGFWSNVEVTKDKWGNIYISGGGHHRVEALRRLIADDEAEKIRGLFQNDDGEWCAKFIVKKYSKEEMLKMFMLENADAWGKDSQQNICMMTIQVKDYLDQQLKASDDVDDFIEKVNSPYPLKMDERAYTRAKNNGIGASTMVQFLGENTWSRQAIDFAIKVLYEEGEEGEKLKELAEKLPNVVMAYKFKRLMTTEIDGDKVLSSADDQEKAEKLIKREALTRADLEKADKLKAQSDLTPLAALNLVVEEKKGEKKAETAKAKDGKADTGKKTKPAEEALTALKATRGWLKMMISEKDSWNKAQKATATDLLKEIAGDMKKLAGKK